MTVLYDSRRSDGHGVGFPSCGTSLAVIPPNTRDPHGYYAEVGVRPDATSAQIRARLRLLYRDLHPDTGSRPDPDMMRRVRAIGAVLLDPDARYQYNRTPPGMRMMDEVYRAELCDDERFVTLTADEVTECLSVTSVPGVSPPGGPHYDYLAEDHRPRIDPGLACEWYRHLLAAAPTVGYRRTIKVALCDAVLPRFDAPSAILFLPRRPAPSYRLAVAVLMAVVGFPRVFRHADGVPPGCVTVGVESSSDSPPTP